MLTIARLFGKSPFAPLQTHMARVASCIGKLPSLFTAIVSGDTQAAERIAEEISKLEHEADLHHARHLVRELVPQRLAVHLA